MHEYTPSDIPLPTGWPRCVRSAVIHVISLAHYAITCARGWAANSINARVRLTDQNERLRQDAELLREEIRIKDACMAKIHPHRERSRLRRRLCQRVCEGGLPTAQRRLISPLTCNSSATTMAADMGISVKRLST